MKEEIEQLVLARSGHPINIQSIERGNSGKYQKLRMLYTFGGEDLEVRITGELSRGTEKDLYRFLARLVCKCDLADKR